MSIAGCSGTSHQFSVAKGSQRVRNWKPSSAKVCRRMPGEPAPVSPKMSVMVSPSRRKPRTTLTRSALSQGRRWPFTSKLNASTAPFEALAVTWFGASGSVNCGVPMSDAKRKVTWMPPVSSMPKRPAV